MVLAPNESYAADTYGVGRTRTCSATGGVEGLDFDPTSGGKDVQFEMDNPVCLSVIVYAYANTKIAIYNMNVACGNGGGVRVAPSPIFDAVDLAKSGVKCASNRNAACCSALGRAIGSFGASIVALGILYGVAESVYDNTDICGHSWMKANPAQSDFSAAGYKQTVQLRINGYVRNEDTGTGGLNVANKTYREWFNNGQEYEDNPYRGAVCRDPTGGVSSKNSHGDYPKQKYYLKGIEAGNYGCKKYLVVAGQRVAEGVNADDMREAYNCCIDRSKNYLCIDYKNILVADNPPVQLQRTPTFCKKNDRCTMMRPDYYDGDIHHKKIQNGGIWFDVQEADSNGGLLCAKTYSLCPYNFSVGGGSDTCDYYRDGIWSSSQNRWTIITQDQIDAGQCAENSEVRNADCSYNDKAGRCKNYCQYLVHCAKTSSEDYTYQSNLGSPYFAQACMDFVGDSQNNTGFNTGVIMGKQTHFTAPIAQCIKETLENLFYNRAGHSKCLNHGEYPSADGTCPSGLYASNGNLIYKKGTKVKENSFFETIQKTMSVTIRLALTLAVAFYGVNLLLWKVSLGDKKSILVFIFKIALVMYFALGTAWQDTFFAGFYDSSMVFANMLFKIETSADERKRAGCQFGKVSLADGTQVVSENDNYPPGKEYLAIWDTIDCKMMRYLGFGPQMTNANIASMVIAAYFFGPVGIYFAMSVMIFGFFLVSLGIRALHIFISSAAAIILLIFISPITITCGMFERTKGIFNQWLAKLMSYCLQPMILFAYVAIFISIMDKTLIGSATFTGNPPTKTMSCEKTCVDADGELVPYDGDQAPVCDPDLHQKIINPLDDSVACLLNFQGFGKWHAFEVVGVALPMLNNIFNENVKQRLLTLLAGALIMYLLYGFMDEIPAVIEALVGGGLTKPGQADAVGMAMKAAATAAAVSQRLGRAGAKIGGSVGGSVMDKINRDGGEDSSSAAEAKDKEGGEHGSSRDEDGDDEGDHTSGENTSSDESSNRGDDDKGGGDEDNGGGDEDNGGGDEESNK